MRLGSFQLSLVIFLIAFFVVPNLFAEEPQGPELLFLGNKNIAPVVYLNNNMATGLAVDIVRAMAKHISQPVKIEAVDWSEAQSLVAQGQADALIQINITKEREAIYDFSDPLIKSTFSIFTLTRRIGITGIHDLQGLKVGVEAGGLPQQILSKDPSISLTVIPNFIDGFSLLSKGTIDAVVVDSLVGTYILAENSIRNISMTGEPIATSYSSFAVKKGNETLLKQINAALKTIRDDGTYQNIIDNWKPEEVVYQTRTQITRQIYLTAMIVFVALFGIVSVWVVTLRRELGKRREAERAAKKQYSTLRTIVDSASALVFSVDPNYLYTSFNVEHASMMKGIYEVEIKLNGCLLDYMSVQEDRDLAKSNLDRALTGEQFVMESYSGDELLSRHYFQVAHSPIEQDGHIIGVVVFAHDVTERKRAEDELRESENRYKRLLASVTSYIYTVKVDGGKAIATKHGTGCQAVTGHKTDEFEKDPMLWFNMIYELDRAAVTAQEESILQGQEVAPLEHRIVHSDGHLRWIRNTCVSHFDDQRRLISYDGVIVDITAEKTAEEALLRAAKFETIGLLAGGIAHDFNNLLAGIFGYISLARDFGDPSSKVANYLDKAGSVFQRAKALTQQLLTFSKTNVPVVKLGKLGPLVRKSVDFSLSGTNVKFDLSIPEELWPVCVDENQIGQVLDNLIINAQQAMTQGGTIRISVFNTTVKEGDEPSLRAGRYIKLSVTDQGTGIPENLLNRIFEPFFSTKVTGHGLGLASCRSIINKHGGTIRAESNKGATFVVFLPASMEGVCQDPLEKTGGHRGTGTVLIMDDEESVREILSTRLQRMGYTVVEASGGDEALQKCESILRLRASILDLTIRGGLGGGLETLPRLKALHPDTPIFATSGYFEDPVMSNPTAFGFTDSIQKPYLESDLETMMQKYLGPQDISG